MVLNFNLNKNKQPVTKTYCVYPKDQFNADTGELLGDYEIIDAFSEIDAKNQSQWAHDSDIVIIDATPNCYVIDRINGDSEQYIPEFLIPNDARKYIFEFLDDAMLYYLYRKYDKDNNYTFNAYFTDGKYKVTSNELFQRQSWTKYWKNFIVHPGKDKVETVSKTLILAVLGGLILLLLIVADL